MLARRGRAVSPQTRRAGFHRVQAVVLAELGGLHAPNPQGHTPLRDDDPTRPDEAYFEDVDFTVRTANALGLTIAMLPTWGDRWNRTNGDEPEIFTPENAHVYGRWLGARYRDDGIIWVLGGDRAVKTPMHRHIIEAMADGLNQGDGGAHLRTFHPPGRHGSSQWFAHAPWIDFQMWQSGHSRNATNYQMIAADYARTPHKPTLDGEPGYEDHPASFDPENGHLDAYDCRKSLWWALLAGACGHTYGCHDVWQMWRPGRDAVTWARTPWQDALDLPGASQMRHAKDLLLSRPYESRVPDPGLLRSNGAGTRHNVAARDDRGALIYVAMQGEVALDLSGLKSAQLRASWFDPREGTSQSIGIVARETASLRTPAGGPDWVLVLDG